MKIYKMNQKNQLKNMLKNQKIKLIKWKNNQKIKFNNMIIITMMMKIIPIMKSIQIMKNMKNIQIMKMMMMIIFEKCFNKFIKYKYDIKKFFIY